MTIQVNGLFPGEIYPDDIVGGAIAIYNNVLQNPDDFIDMAESVCGDPYSGISWSKATTTGLGENQNARTNMHIGVSHSAAVTGNPFMQAIHNQYYITLLASSIQYCKIFNIEEPLFHEGYNMLRYEDGQSYINHYDGNTGSGRFLSSVLYLNDNFDGGETEFVNFGLKIEPKAGSMILFPSNYAYSHIAHPVSNGTKYALVTWIHDRET